jgi:transcriptional regulator with XRE-family HTH domain
MKSIYSILSIIFNTKYFLKIIFKIIDFFEKNRYTRIVEAINSRITALRNHLGINQSQFARKIGVTSQFVSTVEAGKSKITESNIRLICLTFGVSETWLRTGEGEMFVSGDPDTDTFIAIYRALSPPFRKMFLEYGRFLIEQQAAMP